MILFLIFYFFLSLACCLYLIIAQSRLRKGPFCIFWNFWRLAQSDRFRFVKVGWVLAMKAPFLFWSEETGLTCPTPGAPCIPRRRPPASSSTHGTPAHHRQQGRPCQMQGRPCKARHARTDAAPSAHDTRQATPGRSGRRRWRACACMLRVQRFYVLVRLILNILLTCTFNHV